MCRALTPRGFSVSKHGLILNNRLRVHNSTADPKPMRPANVMVFPHALAPK
jgi:hypothetical protein